MSNIIKIKRGNYSDLPAAGTVPGELRYCIDTRQLFIDDGINNVEITYSGTTDHSLLDNLSYANSGHTGFQPAGDYATETYVDTISGALHQEILTISGVSGVTAHSDLTELDYASSGHTGFQPAGDYVTDTEMTTISGDIVDKIPSLTGYATETYVSDNYISNSEMTTISGDITAKIPSLTGYATELYVSTVSGSLQTNIDGKANTVHTHDDRYYTEAEITTISGDIVAKIPSLTGYATESYVSTNYIDNSEITTISGNIVSQIPAAYTNEMAQDAVGTIMSGTGSVTVTYNDASNTITISGSAAGMTDIVNDTTPQLGGDLDTNNKNISLTPDLSTDLTGCGIIATMTVDENGLGFGAALHMDSDSHFILCDADLAANMPCMALALETGTGSKKVLLHGLIRNDSWNWTPGGWLFVSTAAGELTHTKPTGTGDQVQVIGIAYTADIIMFNPNYIVIEV